MTAPTPVGPAVTAVLRAAAMEIERRSGEPVDFDGVLANPGALNHLLELLTHPDARALRIAGRNALPEPSQSDDRELARELTAADTDQARTAAAMIRQRVDEYRKASRSARRRNNTPVSQRMAGRDQLRQEQLREQRDRARTQVAALTEENRRLRAEVDGLLGDIATLTTRLETTERRLSAARANTGSVEGLAESLAKLLRRTVTPAESADPRPIAPGESGPLPPADRRLPAPVAISALSVAARQTGLPPQVADGAVGWLPKLLARLATPATPAQTSPERALTVDVLGGGTEIGGSCVLVTAGDTRLLVDAGSRPNTISAETMAPRHIGRALAGRKHWCAPEILETASVG